MGFFKKLFGSDLDGRALATSTDISDYAQIDLLRRFVEPRAGRALADSVALHAWSVEAPAR